MSGARPLLVLDTATRRAVVGLADAASGRLLAADSWHSAHRHGEELLGRLDALLAARRVAASGLGGVVVGTGPGSFTGLRIGLATAKVLAYSLGLPIGGVPTTRALARALADAAVGGDVALILPAGAHDRYVARLRLAPDVVEEVGPAQIVGRLDLDAAVAGWRPVAVDLDPPDVPGEAARLGRLAVDGLAQAIAHEGAAALAVADTADVATLVPAYVALPRGIAAAAAEMQWSPDLR